MELLLTRSKHFKVVKRNLLVTNQHMVFNGCFCFCFKFRPFVGLMWNTWVFTNFNFKMKLTFIAIGSIVSTTRKLINNVRAQTQSYLFFEPKKVSWSCWWLENNFLILQNKMLLLMLFWKLFLKQSEYVAWYGNTINNFLGEQYVLIFSVKMA